MVKVGHEGWPGHKGDCNVTLVMSSGFGGGPKTPPCSGGTRREMKWGGGDYFALLKRLVEVHLHSINSVVYKIKLH